MNSKCDKKIKNANTKLENRLCRHNLLEKSVEVTFLYLIKHFFDNLNDLFCSTPEKRRPETLEPAHLPSSTVKTHPNRPSERR